MPRLDKTGPRGLGPKTGRGLGNCSNQTENNSSTNNNFGQRCGLGLKRKNCAQSCCYRSRGQVSPY